MSKLSFEALSQRADEVISQELLQSISGGTEDSCHDDPPAPPPPEPQDGGACQDCQQGVVTSQGSHTPLGTAVIHWLFH